MFKKIKHVHFVGIGGSGMSGIAEVLLKLGYHVSGSDLTKTAVSRRLEELGAAVFEGHKASNVKGADVVVTSTAVPPTNPEVKEANKLSIPIIPRIEMLAEIARLKYTIAIAGTHGKTTTTSLVGQIFKYAGLDPTVIVGGRLKAVGTGGVLGNGDFLVAEADESDGSFLKLSPTISVITNIDNDHLDYYGTMKKLEDAFMWFAGRVPFYGCTYVCAEDPGVKRILPKLKRCFSTYGFGPESEFQAQDVSLDETGARFTVIHKKKKLGSIHIPLSGRHNVLNALAATAVALHAEIPFEKIAEALSQFAGVGRRLEIKGDAGGVTVVDDYGHHPTEIKATLAAAKGRWPKRRVVVLFQPHRYTRTKLLAKEFADVLSAADKLLLLPIYAASEKPIKGISVLSISSRIKKKNWQLWSSDKSISDLREIIKPGDVLLTLGAGDVWKIGERWLKEASTLASSLEQLIPTLQGRIKSEEPLSRHCTWAIGGPAEAYVEVHTVSELVALQKYCTEHHVPFFILGWGSNILLPDEGLRGCVIRLRGDFESIQIKGAMVSVGAGVHLPKLAKLCAEKGLEGVEAMAGIPGTLGGSLMTNAGTPRGEIGTVVKSVDVLNADGSVATLSQQQIHFTYRHSDLRGKWILGAVLALTQGHNGSAMEKVKFELSSREKTQPLGTKNVGSVFKNPPNDHAARLVEAAGLKGVKMGRVRVSPKHANFIENTGGATAAEALALVNHVHDTVKEKFGVDLQLEVFVVKQS